MADVDDAHLKKINTSQKAISRVVTVGNLVVLHWALFWVMNGLDKFLNRTDLGLFIWHGKDRSTQFGKYFEDTGIQQNMLEGLLYITGGVELLASIPLFLVLFAVTTNMGVNRRIFEYGFFSGAAIFSGFSFFDVIIGDRAELWEHGTFLTGLLLSYKLAKDEFEKMDIFV